MEALLILVLIIANGVFAMSEIAVVSSRKARLQQRAQEGDKRAAAALLLAENPNDFLSTVQIGITLIGTLAGAFGGATLSGKLAVLLQQVPLLAPYAETASITLVVVAIAFTSLVLGELVPKRIGLNSPETIASLVARPMKSISWVARPAVRFLSLATELVLKVLPFRIVPEQAVTEEEIKVLIEQGTEEGTFESAEHEMVKGVFALGDLHASDLMTPRLKVGWLDLESTEGEIHRFFSRSTHSHFPVAAGTLDRVEGIVHAKDLLARSLRGEPLNLRDVLQKPLFVPEGMPALRLLEELQKRQAKLAMVVNEHGGVQGLVTLHDVTSAITNTVSPEAGVQRPRALPLEEGCWRVDGLLPAQELKQLLSIQGLPREEEGYSTVGGLVMTALGRVPIPGDEFSTGQYDFSVEEMDGNRVDKVIVRRVTSDALLEAEKSQ